ncbi:hypothetical protein BT69DRAFT_1288002 [Atractiella rhizophila]|nr:hypothetical protein BT69DRAFT_1288002 [Atractiella rhizophila]
MKAWENRMQYEASKIKSPDYLPVIATVVGMFIATGKKGEHGQFLWLWIAFLLLIVGLVWVDVSSRCHAYSAAERHQNGEPFAQIVPLLLFWGFHLIFAYQFTSEHLDDHHKWVLHLLPLVIGIWALAVLALCCKRIKKFLGKITRRLEEVIRQ